MVGFWQNCKRIYLFDVFIVPEHNHEQNLFGTNKIIQGNVIGDKLSSIVFEETGVRSIIGGIK